MANSFKLDILSFVILNFIDIFSTFIISASIIIDKEQIFSGYD